MTEKEELQKKATELGLPLEDENQKSFTIKELKKAIEEKEKPDDPNTEDGTGADDITNDKDIDSGDSDENDDEPQAPVETKKKNVKEKDVPFVVKLREEQLKNRNLQSEMNELKKNSVPMAKYNELKSNLASKEKACAELRKEIFKLKGQN